MDWNVETIEIEHESVGEDGGGAFFVQPQAVGATTSVVTSQAEGAVDFIPIEQRSNVVLRTLEGVSVENAGVEVIGFLDEGQPIPEHMLQSMNEDGGSLTEEELLAQIRSQESQIQRLSGASEEPSVVNIGRGIIEELPQAEQVENSDSSAAVLQQGISTLGEGEVLVDEGIKELEESSKTLQEEAEMTERESVYSGTTIVDTDTHTCEGGVDESINVIDKARSDSSVKDEVNNASEIEVITSDLDGDSNWPPQKSSSLESCGENDERKQTENQSTIATIVSTDTGSHSSQLMPPPSRTVVLDPQTGKFLGVLSLSPVKSTTHIAESHDEDDIVIEISDQEEDSFELLNDVPEVEDDVVQISSDEEDEGFKIQVENARTIQKMKQTVDDTAGSYRPRFVSREKLNRKHPRCKGLTFKDIMNQAINEDKILPDMNEQVIPRKIADKLRANGHTLHRSGIDGGFMVSSKRKNIKMYYSSFSARFEPVLADAVLENYVQEFRKTLNVSRWQKRLGTKEVDPSSVIPASIGSTGSSSIGSETDPECLATDEEESESELMQGSVAAWIIPDAIASRTPSPEPDFDEPQFITTQVGSHTIVEGPPSKKRKQKHHEPQPHTDGKIYPKPAFSYSCLIAMALKNSKTGSLPVSEIYKFMCDHFPYFKSAPSGWKNSVRHNLSLNKCFEKIEKPGNNGARKGCLWALNPAKIHKMDEEVQKWSRKDPLAIRRAMSDPENLELIEKGELKRDYSGAGASDDDEDEDFSEPATPLTPAQAQARRSRTNSSDSTLEGTTAVVTPVVTTVSQVHAALQRSMDPKSQIHVKREDAVEIGTITNIQGNYVNLCHTPTGNGTYTLSFANLGSSSPLTPIIIRRTPTVK